jgi:hypothetical protein
MDLKMISCSDLCACPAATRSLRAMSACGSSLTACTLSAKRLANLCPRWPSSGFFRYRSCWHTCFMLENKWACALVHGTRSASFPHAWALSLLFSHLPLSVSFATLSSSLPVPSFLFFSFSFFFSLAPANCSEQRGDWCALHGSVGRQLRRGGQLAAHAHAAARAVESQRHRHPLPIRDGLALPRPAQMTCSQKLGK